MTSYSCAQVIGKASIEPPRFNIALENVDIKKLRHGVTCRVEARAINVASRKHVHLRQGYGATVYALIYDASVDWR
jgi:hypothetical protein